MTAPRNDFPVWAGTDRILDLNAGRNRLFYVGCALGGFAVWVWFSVMIGVLFGQFFVMLWEGAEDRHHVLGVLIVPAVWLALAVMAGLLVGVPLLVLRYMTAHEIAVPLFPWGFITRDWQLHAGVGAMGLSYDASEFSPYLNAMGVGRSHWSVSLDQIARVEAGRTAEWIPHRPMEGGPVWASGQQGDGVFLSGGMVIVPPTEYQAFVFCNDGSRLVFFTMHDGLEIAQRLAASVRSWVETQRAARPKESMLLQAAGERREGFDL